MYHHPIRFPRRPSPKLKVQFPTFESARAFLPNCERSALRAFALSEARRIANALIRPAPLPQNFTNVIALFTDADAVGHAALRQKRFDFVLMLMRSGRFERRIARRLIAQGKLGAGVLA
jgi:hypothetical protein